MKTNNLFEISDDFEEKVETKFWTKRSDCIKAIFEKLRLSKTSAPTASSIKQFY